MPRFADCPFRVAFRAVAAVLPLVDADESDADLLAELGFKAGSDMILARFTVAAGLDDAFAHDAGESVAALQFLRDFVRPWEDFLREEGREDVWGAAMDALAVALDPAVAEAFSAGWRAGVEAVQPGAGPFPGAARAAMQAGLAPGPSVRRAFVSGFLSALPAGDAVVVDPVHGHVIVSGLRAAPAAAA